MRLTKRFASTAVMVGVLTLTLPSAGLAEEQDGDAAEAAIEMTEGEEELAKLLEGREAGEPVSCIRHRLNDRVRIIDDTALVYGRGKTIYVNYTNNPKSIDDWDTLVTRRFGSSFCKTDIVTKIDPTSGIFAGSIFLSEFIPYKRVEKEDS